MFLNPTFIVLSVLLLLSGVWCYQVFRRLPRDIRELRQAYAKYATRNDPMVLGTMKKESRRRLYQEQCAHAFWTTLAVDVLFIWPVTVACLVFILIFGVGGIILPIVRQLGRPVEGMMP